MKRYKQYQVLVDCIFENGAVVIRASVDKKNLEQVHHRDLVVVVGIVEVKAYLLQHFFVFENQQYLFAVLL